ncbi:MAG TPA: cytochrome c [Usitatibacter sp.]|nr:cytochrome c [Usitatibacter sp.]
MSALRHVAAVLLVLAGLGAAPVAAQNVANGQTLYNTICIVCHGFPPAGGPERAAGNPAAIRNAINGGVGPMRFLGSILTQQDIVDIAAYLLSLTSAPMDPVPQFDYSDLWWGGVQESGWGLNLIQHPSHTVFGVLYTYEAPNRPAWFVMPGGTWLSPTLYEGAFYRVTGPHLNMAPFDPAAVNVRQVGTARLSFSGRDNATFIFTVDGVQVTKSISRQPF